jgi:hypothetical protein
MRARRIRAGLTFEDDHGGACRNRHVCANRRNLAFLNQDDLIAGGRTGSTTAGANGRRCASAMGAKQQARRETEGFFAALQDDFRRISDLTEFSGGEYSEAGDGPNFRWCSRPVYDEQASTSTVAGNVFGMRPADYRTSYSMDFFPPAFGFALFL